MAEEALRIPSAGGAILEGRLLPGAAGAGAGVVCHPHPLYGGEMHNNVVLAARDVLGEKGLAAVRFNFRGVGRSTGAFDNGRGEAEDVAAVFQLLEERGLREIRLVGYSFGAWVALLAVSRRLVVPAGLTLISPPVDFMDFAGLALPACPAAVVVGDADQFCSQRGLARWLSGQPSAPRPVVLKGTDHFYGGREEDLKAALREVVG